MRIDDGHWEYGAADRGIPTSARERVAARRKQQRCLRSPATVAFPPQFRSARCGGAAREHCADQGYGIPWSDGGQRLNPFSLGQDISDAFIVHQPLPHPTATASPGQFRRHRRYAAERIGAQRPPRSRRRVLVKPGIRIVVRDWFDSGRLASLLLFVITIAGIAMLFTAQVSTVRHITVTGNTILSEETIARLANIEQTSLWFIDKAAVARNIQRSAYVERVQVDLALPNQVRIDIAERQPEVYWKQGPFLYLVDRHGYVLEQTDVPPRAEAIVIEDTTGVVQQAGDRVDPDAIRLAHALALRLPTELQLTPQRIGWDFGLGVYIVPEEGQTVVFGQYANLERKLRVLDFVLDSATPFTYLDLRPSAPFYRHQASSAGTSGS